MTTPLRPHLFRAIYEWTLENGLTPHIVIDATIAGVTVPAMHVRDGQITLNVHPQAVRQFVHDANGVAFFARFSGREFGVHAPMAAVKAIFAKENGRGMFFQDEPAATPPHEPPTPVASSPKKAPLLKRVK